MEKIKIAVRHNGTCLLAPVNLVSGTVGQPCVFYFDDYWKSLPNKKVSYKINSTVVGTYPLEEDSVEIPPHILTSPDTILEIGVIGYSSDNKVVTPTTWCHIGRIMPGTTIGVPAPGEDVIVYYDGGVIL